MADSGICNSCGQKMELEDVAICDHEGESFFELRLICKKCGTVKDVRGGSINGTIKQTGD